MLKRLDSVAMHRVLLDSSSAILLAKAGMLKQVMASFIVLLPQSVVAELTRQNLPAAECIDAYQHDSPQNILHEPPPHSAQLARMGAGERDCILFYKQDLARFLITDDGKAARYCKKHTIPFINALLLPKVLFFHGALSKPEENQFSTSLLAEGRYSSFVQKVAHTADKQSLQFFLP